VLAALAFNVTYKSAVESFSIITVFLLLFAANNVTDVTLLATFVNVDVAAKAGLMDKEAEEVFVPSDDGSLPSMLASDVLPVVWFADVAAPVGSGKLAALIGCVTPLPSTNKRVAVTVKLLGSLVLILAKLPPDSNANKDVFKLVPALAVKLVLVKVKLGAVPILNVGVDAKAGNVPVRPTLQVPC
jgi:hypothetical protein